MKLLMIDNYDSFTYNLVHYLGELGAEVEVIRNDKISAEEAVKLGYEGIVISPGPATPQDAGISIDIVLEADKADIPLLGVCLGHQSIAVAYGGTVLRLDVPKHGKTDIINHNGEGLFSNIDNPFIATRYHSLFIDKSDIADCLEICAETKDRIIMGIKHKQKPIFGIQFHPESIATECGHKLLNNFVLSIKNHNS